MGILSVKSKNRGPVSYAPESKMVQDSSGNWVRQGMEQIPETGRFNPYDYIDVNDYARTKRGQAQYTEDLARLQYLAELRQQDFQNEYNSPEKQAELMRSAGLNPDLSGISGDTTSAGLSAPSVNPMAGMTTPLEDTMSVFGMIQNVASLATTIAGVPSILSNGISSAVGAGNSALTLFENFANDPTQYETFVQSLPNLTGRQKNKLGSMYHNFITSRRGNIGDLKGQTEEMKATGDFYRYSGDRRYNAKTEKEYTDAWKPFIDAMTEASMSELEGKTTDTKIKKQTLRSATAKAGYDEGYYSYDLGTDDASTKKSQNQATRAETDILTTLKKPLLEVFKNFEENEKNAKGDDREFWTYAKAALAGFALNMYKGGSPNLNFDFGLLGLLGGNKGKKGKKLFKKLGK